MTEVTHMAFERPWREYWTEEKQAEFDRLVAPSCREVVLLQLKLAFIEGMLKGQDA